MPEALRLEEEPRFKVWRISANDDKIRGTHLAANGQVRFVGEPFQVGDAQLMEPRDPNGPPEETYNCRCTKEEYSLSDLPKDLLPQIEHRLTERQRLLLQGVRFADVEGESASESQARPSFGLLTKRFVEGVKKYKDSQSFMISLGGKVEVNAKLPVDKGGWTNSCTVRMSNAINGVPGHEIPFTSNETVSDKNGQWNMFRVDTMEKYLEQTYGPPDGISTNKSDFLASFGGKKGIVALKISFSDATGHFSIWDGKKLLDGKDRYFNNPRLEKILFWELPD